MIDIKQIQEALAIKWINKLLEGGNGTWRLLPTLFLNKISPRLSVLQSNIKYGNLRGLPPHQPYFYSHLLKLWLNSKHWESNVVNSSQVLWNNSLFSYRNNPIYIQRWIKHGIAYIGDIINTDGRIDRRKMQQYIPYSPLTEFELNIIHNATKNVNLTRYQDSYLQVTFKGHTLNHLTTKQIRKLMENENDLKKNILTNFKWEDIQTYADIQLIYNLPSITTKETKLRVLQWKILHKILPTNHYLHRVKITDNSTCDFCDNQDTIEHHLLECYHVQKLWSVVADDIHLMNGKRLTLDKKSVIFGIYNQDLFKSKLAFIKTNYIILIAKQTIVKYKSAKKLNLLLLYEREKSLRNITY